MSEYGELAPSPQPSDVDASQEAPELQDDAQDDAPQTQQHPAPAVHLPQTGDQRVDEALEPLATVRHAPPAEQVEVYVGVHRALQDRLADLEG